MLIQERPPYKRSWRKKEVVFGFGYEGRLIERPAGLHQPRRRGSKKVKRLKRSKPAFGGYMPYVVRPGRW